jgi:site-specific recombinase XerD
MTMESHPIEPLIEDYLAQKDLAPRSRDLYRTILRQYASYLRHQGIRDATTEDVRHYIEWKRGEGHSSSWMFHQIQTIKGLYRYLTRHHRRLGLPSSYEHDITAGIPNERRRARNTKRVLSVDEARHLLSCTKLNRTHIWQYRDHAILALMLTTGLRSVEIRRARKRDLRTVQGQTLLYIQGKGRQAPDAFVKLAQGALDALMDYLAKRKDKNPYLFVSHSHHTEIPHLSRSFFHGMWKRVLRECGMEDIGCSIHALRHTAATLNLLRGASLEATRRLLRHEDARTTLRYAHHITRQTDDSERAIEQYILNNQPRDGEDKRGEEPSPSDAVRPTP